MSAVSWHLVAVTLTIIYFKVSGVLKILSVHFSIRVSWPAQLPGYARVKIYFTKRYCGTVSLPGQSVNIY